MKLTKFLHLATLAGLLVPSITYASEQFGSEASVTLASMYLFRGFDMTHGDPAIQGDYILSHDSGFWVGAWASNYDLLDLDDGVEIDIIGGYNLAINNDVTIGVGFTEYTYTGNLDSTTEYFVSLSVGDFSITYNDDVDLDAVYISIDAEFSITEDLSLALHAASYNFEDVGDTNEYSVGINYSLNDVFSAFLTYSDNDLNVIGAENYTIAGASYSF